MSCLSGISDAALRPRVPSGADEQMYSIPASSSVPLRGSTITSLPFWSTWCPEAIAIALPVPGIPRACRSEVGNQESFP